MMKMMKNKGKGEMSEQKKQAKMEVLQELLELAMDSSGKQIGDGMQKLTVAAPDKEGLMEGLDKAEEVLEPEGEELTEGVEDMMMDSEEDMEDEMSEEDEDEKMLKLKEMMGR